MDAAELIRLGDERKLGDFYRKLRKDDKLRILSFVEQLRKDSRDRFTETEEQQYAMMMWFIDQVNAQIASKGLAEVAPELLEISRKYNDMLMTALRKSREEEIRPPSIVEELQAAAAQLTSRDGVVQVAWKKRE